MNLPATRPAGRLRRLAANLGFVLVAASPGCGDGSPGTDQSHAPAKDRGPTTFTDVTKAAGITHRHAKPVLDPKLDNIMAWMASVGAAAAAGDYDGDGWVDLYVTSSRKGTPNRLYRNNHDGTFTDVAREAGLADVNDEGGVSMDCAWGDYDNDGRIDLYVVRWGTDRLFRNHGDGTFTDVTARCFRKKDGSPGIDWANGNAVIWFDANLDGRLDLYVGNYFREVDLWHLESTRIMHEDFERARNGGLNFFFRQQPDGTFTECAEALGLEDPGWTLAVGAGDLDNDGWPDLYCANDFGPDQLFLNRRDGTFANVTAQALGFDTKKGMNVDLGDFNNDGWLDVYVTNITTADYLQEGNMLWYNNGPGSGGGITFTDVAPESGTRDGGWGWGAKFLDYDNDGYLDIVALNGFISAGRGNYWYDLASWTVRDSDPADAARWPPIKGRSFSGYERTRLWRGDGRYGFTEVARAAGLENDRDGRGVVCLDYDNDGDLDLFLANQGQPPNLYRNNGAPDNRWLEVALEGRAGGRSNRDAIGARVTLVTSRGWQIRERDGGNGYAGQSDPRLHFGLGAEDRVKLLEVRWPDGGLQYREDLPADRIVTLRQDPGRYASKVAITIGRPAPRRRPGRPPRASKPTAPRQEVERILSPLEARLRARPPGYTAGSAYRARCAALGEQDRAIRFFETLVEARPGDVRARLQLACAYVDKIPTCGGVAAIVSKGTLARKALDQLDRVLAEHGASWVAYYLRGMNHLYWPRMLRHADDAVRDLTRCLELPPSRGAPERRSDRLRVHVAIGDACVKDNRFDRARAAWRAALKRYPRAAALRRRLAIEDDKALLDYVESRRSLEKPIDTDLSFLDRDRRRG